MNKACITCLIFLSVLFALGRADGHAHERAVDPAESDRVHTVLLAKAHETLVDEPGIGHRQDVERGIVGKNTLDARRGRNGAGRAS